MSTTELRLVFEGQAVGSGKMDSGVLGISLAGIEKAGKLRADNTVVKVYEVLPRPKQMWLDGEKDDEPPIRAIGFEDV